MPAQIVVNEATSSNKESLYHSTKMAKLRIKILDVYGHACVCCREAETKFLTIDHVDNDGWKHRKSFRGHIFYEILREGFPPGKYQTMCWNCNLGKVRNKGECPHKQL